MRFRSQKPHVGNYERDWLRFYDTMSCRILRGTYTLLPPSCAQNVVDTGLCFLIVRRDNYIQEKRQNFAVWVYQLHIWAFWVFKQR